MIKQIKTALITLCLAAATITGCGGGGGGSTPEPTPVPVPTPTPDPVTKASAKGFWTNTTGTTVTQAIILANGETWIVWQNAGTATGLGQLPTVTSENSINGIGTQYTLQTGITSALAFSGTFTEKQEISANLSTGNLTSTLRFAYDANYDNKVSITDASGAWNGSYGGVSNSLNMTISQTGALSGSSTTGCSYLGNLQPRTADPAVFDITVSETCVSGTSVELTGIATMNSAKSALSFAAVTADKTAGVLFSGKR